MGIKKSSIKKSKREVSSPTKIRPATKPKKTSATTRSSTRVQKRTSGVSRVAPTGTSSEETRAKLDRLQRELDGLQRSLLLTSAHNEMGEIETTLSLLPAQIEELRTRGYVFRSFLENKINVLAGQWEETHDRVSREVRQRQLELEREAEVAENALRQAMSGRASRVSHAESAINTLERKARAAQSAVGAMYDALQQNVDQTRSQVEEIRWLLDQVDEASFPLYPAEDPVSACKAQYMETRKEGPKGVLYLTDERLIFEQKEEKATKKVLFITTDKEMVQQLIFEVPVGQVEETKASDKGFLGRKEMLELRFAPEADLSEATLRLHGVENEEWAGLIGRVKSGEIAKERTRPKEEAAVGIARAAPTKCPTCGATLSVEIVRGMREITCEYCGSVIRL
jgi:hypothetical protein